MKLNIIASKYDPMSFINHNANVYERRHFIQFLPNLPSAKVQKMVPMERRTNSSAIKNIQPLQTHIKSNLHAKATLESPN